MSKKIFKIPYYFLIAGVVLLGALLLATLLPIPGNLKVKIVKSGSMEPAIRTGGIVFIRSAASYGVGDIITFGKDTKTQIPTTHRIIEETGSGRNKIFTTKGDANDSIDPEGVRADTVIGKVLFTIPYAGFVLDFAKKPIGFALLVGIPALIIIFEELLNIWKEVKKIKRKEDSEDTSLDVLANELENESLVRSREIYKEGNVLDLRAKFEYRPRTDSNKVQNHSDFGFKAVAIFFTALLPILGLGSVGNTISFYSEREVSTGNLLRASGDFGFVVNNFRSAVSTISDFVPSLSEIQGEVLGTEGETQETEEVEEGLQKEIQEETEEEKVEKQFDSSVVLDEEEITENDKTEENLLDPISIDAKEIVEEIIETVETAVVDTTTAPEAEASPAIETIE